MIADEDLQYGDECRYVAQMSAESPVTCTGFIELERDHCGAWTLKLWAGGTNGYIYEYRPAQAINCRKSRVVRFNYYAEYESDTYSAAEAWKLTATDSYFEVTDCPCHWCLAALQVTTTGYGAPHDSSGTCWIFAATQEQNRCIWVSPFMATWRFDDGGAWFHPTTTTVIVSQPPASPYLVAHTYNSTGGLVPQIGGDVLPWPDNYPHPPPSNLHPGLTIQTVPAHSSFARAVTSYPAGTSLVAGGTGMDYADDTPGGRFYLTLHDGLFESDDDPFDCLAVDSGFSLAYDHTAPTPASYAGVTATISLPDFPPLPGSSMTLNWHVVVAGVSTDDPATCADDNCTLWNGTHDLTYIGGPYFATAIGPTLALCDSISPPALVRAAIAADLFYLKSADTWYLRIGAFAPYDSSQSHEAALYSLAGASFNNLDDNTFNYVSDDGFCNGWPATLLLEAGAS